MNCMLVGNLEQFSRYMSTSGQPKQNIVVGLFCMYIHLNELDTLDYSGIAVAFSEENTLAIGTSKTLKCFNPEFIEYIHAVIIAGKSVV